MFIKWAIQEQIYPSNRKRNSIRVRINAIAIFLGGFLLLTSCTHDAENYHIHGIDVSHYQKEIDWNKIAKEENIHFAFIKATESIDYQDSIFEKNWEAAKEVGIIRGAYHFFRPNVSVEWQIKNFTKQVQLKKGDLPPVLDIEDFKNVSMTTLIERARLWLIFIEEHYNIRPIIYTSLDVYTRHLQTAFAEYPVWIARYSRTEPPQETRWQFWQYSDEGSVKGISGNVDKNVFVGTIAELEALCVP